MLRRFLAVAGIVGVHGDAALHNALQSAQFLSSGTISANDTIAYMPISCQYLEPENVTAAQSSWGEGGTCPYAYQVVGAVPPATDCTPSAATPGFDRGGGDYNAVMLPSDDWTACQAKCCGESQCMSWVST